MNRRADRVCVVGCGVAGATVGFLLAERGVEVTVVEQSPVLGPVGAGVLLQPIGMQVLSRMGLLDAIRARSEPIRRLHAVTQSGKCLNDLPYDEYAPDCHALGIHRGDLFDLLYERLKQTSARIITGKSVGQCVQDQDGVRVLEEAGEETGEETSEEIGQFDYVIAADGSRSAARVGAFRHVFEHEYAFGAIWITGQCTAIREKLYQVTHGSR